jgi:uncharacterized protein YukJ
MPIPRYGVWKCKGVEWDPRKTVDHGHLTFEDGANDNLDCAVDVESKGQESRLVYWHNTNFDHPVTAKLRHLNSGFHASHGPGGVGLDYLRTQPHLLNINDGVIRTHEGDSHDIIHYIDPILNQAVDSQADIYLFGQRYGNNGQTSHGRHQHHSTQDGIHDIHFNQGSQDSVDANGRTLDFSKDNGTWQDGGIIIQFPDGHWESIFLAFASQASQTDQAGDANGPLLADILPVDTGAAPAADGDGTGLGDN